MQNNYAMQRTPSRFIELNDPDPNSLGETYLEFLLNMAAPVWMTISGKDNSRSRAIVTLLHGNEPSGLKAIHKMLKAGIQPATRLGIFVASINAAIHPPTLSHRFLPGEEDLNRCFNPPVNTNQRELAQALLAKLHSFNPEAVIDTHNTSGHSEAFAVAIRDDRETRLLTQKFTDKLIVIDQALGTLIEQRKGHCPIVTIEFGGFTDPKADRLAEETLENYITCGQLFDDQPAPILVLEHSLRLELNPGYQVHYSSSVQDESLTTIFNTIDQRNFETLEAGTPIGWPGPNGISSLIVKSATGEDLTNTYFAVKDGFIVTQHKMTIFMATTDDYVARQDCLLYLTPVN